MNHLSTRPASRGWQGETKEGGKARNRGLHLRQEPLTRGRSSRPQLLMGGVE